MKIEIKLDNTCKEPRIVVICDKITQDIDALVKRLSGEMPQILAGFKDDTLEILDEEEIIHIFTGSGKVVASTKKGKYVLRLRLYELEERLDKSSFVRISNSEIINLRQVKNFDLSFSGTICVTLLNGAATYVSRRYVAGIKQVLGI